MSIKDEVGVTKLPQLPDSEPKTDLVVSLRIPRSGPRLQKIIGFSNHHIGILCGKFCVYERT